MEHQARDASPHSQRSGESDPPAMDVDEESSVGRDRCLTFTEVKVWSFRKLEGLTRPSFSGGLVKPLLSQRASRRLGNIQRPDRWMDGTSQLSEVSQGSGRVQGVSVQALPFRLSPAPREFCRVTGVLGTLLHKLTIYLHLYLDDLLLRAMSRAICLSHTQIALEKAQIPGFLVNWAKSELIPTERLSS